MYQISFDFYQSHDVQSLYIQFGGGMKLDHQYGNKIKSPLAMKPIYLLKKELNNFEILFLKINKEVIWLT